MDYKLAYPWEICPEPGSPDWARTIHALRALAHEGRVDVVCPEGDPGPVPPRPQLGPVYERAYARARYAAGYCDVVVLRRERTIERQEAI